MLLEMVLGKGWVKVRIVQPVILITESGCKWCQLEMVCAFVLMFFSDVLLMISSNDTFQLLAHVLLFGGSSPNMLH